MSDTGGKKHRHFILALQTQAVNGHIAFLRFRITCIAQSHGDIRACILFCSFYGRKQPAYVKAFILTMMDNFLTYTLCDYHRIQPFRICFIHQEGKLFTGRIQQARTTLSITQKSDQNSGTRMILDIGKQHCRAKLCGTL